VRIIGVVDLKDGQAVHARGGRRDEYVAVAEALGVTIAGSPIALARLYRDQFHLAEVYVADLNAIAGSPPNCGVLSTVTDVGASLIVDAGVTSVDAARQVARAAQTIVVGLETLPSMQILAAICSGISNPIAFSLDLREGLPITRDSCAASPEEIAAQAVEAGADAILVLDVARVGTGAGPDLDMLRRIRQAAPAIPLLAGGGVRGLNDLRELANAGCDGALVATALHDGRLTRADVKAAKRL
jgi:phosphoribosylformimino-5-aminoimidazole carboxamide ribotide isomerase